MKNPLPRMLAPLYEQMAMNRVMRRPISRILGGLGTSFTANCHTMAATANASELHGYLFWAASETGMYAPHTENYGNGGDTTFGFLARLAACVAGQASIILIPDFTNDPESVPVGATKRNLMRIASELMTAGKIPIFGTGTQLFGTATLTPTGQARYNEVRRWLLNDMKDTLAVVDTYPLLNREDTLDDKHPNISGAKKLGEAFAPMINQQNFLDYYALPGYADDQWSATNNPFGCLTLNPALTGAEATVSASTNPVAGSVIATGWKASGSALGTVTTRWYKELNADGTETQCIEIKGTPAAGGFIAFQPSATTVTLANLAAADKLRMFGVVDTFGKGLMSAEAELMVTKGGTVNYARSGDKYQEPWTLPERTTQRHETMTYTFVGDASETLVTGRVGIFLSAIAVDAVVKIRLPGIRKF